MTKYQPPKDPSGLSRLVRTWLEPWMSEALCAQVDPTLWFPDKADVNKSAKKARQICARCPVIDSCREYALLNKERFGIWANTTERDRRKLFKDVA